MQPLSTYSATYEGTVGGRVLIDNIADTQKALDKLGTGKRLPIYLSSDYHAGSVSGREPIVGKYNFFSLDDMGYTSSFRITGYNTSVDENFRQFYGYNYVNFTMAFTSSFTDNVFLSKGNLYINLKFDAASKNLTFVAPGEPYNYPTFQAGKNYSISIFVSGMPDGVRVGFNWPDGSVDKTEMNTAVFKDGYLNFSFDAAKDFSFGDLKHGPNSNLFYFTGFPAGWSGDLQMQTLTVMSNDYEGVEDAIRDQTDDMNQNHDETMDKIDDVTDFDSTEQGQMSGDVDDVTNSFNEKMGILSFADSIFDQFFGLFETDNKKPGLVLPAFSIEVQNTSYKVWDKQIFDLSQIDGWFSGLMTAVRFATSFLIYAALIMYIQKIFSAIVQDWSDR